MMISALVDSDSDEESEDLKKSIPTPPPATSKPAPREHGQGGDGRISNVTDKNGVETRMEVNVADTREDGDTGVENVVVPEPPKYWTEVSRKGVVVEGFLPFKIPIEKEHQMDEEYVFTPEMFVATQMKNGECELQMVISLVPEEEEKIRYDSSVWDKHQIRYVNIGCTDPYMPPTEKEIKVFVKTCAMVFRRNPNKNIGVHDILSHNVAGYLIVCYLVEEVGWSVHRSVEAFHNARPPGIYSCFMLDSLYSRYSETMPLNSRYPDPPSWDTDYIALKNLKKAESASVFKVPSLPAIKKRSITPENESPSKHPRTSPDPAKSPSSPRIGVHVKTPHLERLVDKLCKLLEKPYETDVRFPPFLRSASPLPENLSTLKEGNYWATWKTQGTHYTMMIISEGVFLYSADGELSHVKITFPSASGPAGGQPPTLNNTVIQGEMVVDVDNNTSTQRFLITDILVLEGQPLYSQVPLRKRLDIAQAKLIQPRNMQPAMTRTDYFRVRLKSYVPVFCDPATDKEHSKTGRLAALVRELTPTLPHAWDGVVFVPEGVQLEENVHVWTLQDQVWKTFDDLLSALNSV
ncbi:protein-tyrosine phosphatase-like protein [Chytridium lagenaria]|nr:protein-tyrosine phosphatase-like protein [Chytridium lagenaria]